MVVTAQPETGMEENYAVVEREPGRLPTFCAVLEPLGGTTIDDGAGGDSSEVAGLAVSAVGAPTTGAGPTVASGGPALWAAVALAMAGAVALDAGARQMRRRER